MFCLIFCNKGISLGKFCNMTVFTEENNMCTSDAICERSACSKCHALLFFLYGHTDVHIRCPYKGGQVVA